jgi:hypothetical protein
MVSFGDGYNSQLDPLNSNNPSLLAKENIMICILKSSVLVACSNCKILFDNGRQLEKKAVENKNSKM